MAFIAGRNCGLMLDISSVYTDIAQLIDIELPESAPETVAVDTLDTVAAGITYSPTGRVEGGECRFTGYLDPVGTTFQALTDIVTAPTTHKDKGWKVVFSDAASTEWPFTGASLSIGGTVSLQDHVRFTGRIKLSGIPTYPT